MPWTFRRLPPGRVRGRVGGRLCGGRRGRRLGPLFATALLTTALLVGAAAPLAAQIRGGRRPMAQQPDHGWWFSGGANAVTLNDIADGRTNTRWKFGADPLWQFRATLEKALDEGSTLGIAAGYGVVDVTLEPLVVVPSLPGAVSRVCASGCEAQTELYTLTGQFRSGGGQRGFHTIFVLAGGANAFRNFTVRATGDSVPGLTKLQTDLGGTLGGGFAYALSRGLVVELIQDFGIGWHSKENLADGQGRTYRSRSTRAGLRFQFGGNQ